MRRAEAPAKPPAEKAVLELADAELSLLAIDGETKAARESERTFLLPAGPRQVRVGIRHPIRPGGSSGSAQAAAEVGFEARAGSIYRLMYAADRSTGAGFSQMALGVTLSRDGVRCFPIGAQQWRCP